jgi:hypothetical protein
VTIVAFRDILIDALSRGNPVVCKIDREGAEEEFLASPPPEIGYVGQMLIEAHSTTRWALAQRMPPQFTVGRLPPDKLLVSRRRDDSAASSTYEPHWMTARFPSTN